MLAQQNDWGSHNTKGAPTYNYENYDKTIRQEACQGLILSNQFKNDEKKWRNEKKDKDCLTKFHDRKEDERGKERDMVAAGACFNTHSIALCWYRS